MKQILWWWYADKRDLHDAVAGYFLSSDFRTGSSFISSCNIALSSGHFAQFMKQAMIQVMMHVVIHVSDTPFGLSSETKRKRKTKTQKFSVQITLRFIKKSKPSLSHLNAVKNGKHY